MTDAYTMLIITYFEASQLFLLTDRVLYEWLPSTQIDARSSGGSRDIQTYTSVLCQ